MAEREGLEPALCAHRGKPANGLSIVAVTNGKSTFAKASADNFRKLKFRIKEAKIGGERGIGTRALHSQGTPPVYPYQTTGETTVSPTLPGFES